MVDVEGLSADAERLATRIAQQREMLASLESERDALVGELRSAGVSERVVGRLLGVSGPRVNQIMRAAKGGERPAKPAKPRAKAPKRTEPVSRAEPPEGPEPEGGAMDAIRSLPTYGQVHGRSRR